MANAQLDSQFTDDIGITKAVNDGNPKIVVGSADAEQYQIEAVYAAGTQDLEYIKITTKTASGVADRGTIKFFVDETEIGEFNDDGLKLAAGKTMEF